jgi:Tfp pilus assembly protein PilF
MFSRALEQDPNAINSMMSLAIVLHLKGRYGDEVPLLRRLIDILPSDAGMLRLGVQAGAWGHDKVLMQKSLELMETHYPKLAPMARSFIEKTRRRRNGAKGVKNRESAPGLRTDGAGCE